MYLRVYKEQGEYVAVAPGAAVHAFGATAGEAIAELMLELDGFHRLLREHAPDRLSLRLHRTLDYLERWRAPRLSAAGGVGAPGERDRERR